MKDLTIKKDYHGHYRGYLKTKKGNTLSVFFNEDKNLLVVDLVSAAEDGGNELVRMTVDEAALLDHVSGAH